MVSTFPKGCCAIHGKDTVERDSGREMLALGMKSVFLLDMLNGSALKGMGKLLNRPLAFKFIGADKVFMQGLFVLSREQGKSIL